LLLHAKHRWPKVISSILWPFALATVIDLHNNLHLNEGGLSPLEILSGFKQEIEPSDCHTWRCPVFVLDEKNQSGSIGPPKWEPRSRAGIYLGHSKDHAGNVAMVLNLRTRHVSPQFHLVFDNTFSTVPYLDSLVAPPNWDNLVKNHVERIPVELSNTTHF